MYGQLCCEQDILRLHSWRALLHGQSTLGDSMVTLMPDCKTDTGKWGEGMLVNHSRKLPCSSDSASVCNLATSFSRSGIHDLTRWQFCRHTQCPAGVQEEQQLYKRIDKKKTLSLRQPTRLTASANSGSDFVSLTRGQPTNHTVHLTLEAVLYYFCTKCSAGIAGH